MKDLESSAKAHVTIRPTKRQAVLLGYIAEFITQHGYSPSYREIMKGCNYNSVATVALHVNSLIKRGHLRKRDKSARSLEVVNGLDDSSIIVNRVNEAEEKWLVLKVEQFFKLAETNPSVSEDKIDELYVLVGMLKVLGLEGAAYAYIRRLNYIRVKRQSQKFSV
jgi:repressor LexA